MSYRIEFTQEVQHVIKKWKETNPNSFQKLYRRKLIPALELGIPNRSRVVEGFLL